MKTSQITSLTIVYSTVYSSVDQRKHQSSASLAFVWGIHQRPVISPHKWSVTRKMFPIDDVIVICIFLGDIVCVLIAPPACVLRLRLQLTFCLVQDRLAAPASSDVRPTLPRQWWQFVCFIIVVNRVTYYLHPMTHYLCHIFSYIQSLPRWLCISFYQKCCLNYCDVIMGAIASQITSLTIVYSTVYSDADQRKHQSSASLAFVRGIHRGPVNSPHKWPVTWKMFLFDDVIMFCLNIYWICTKVQLTISHHWFR